MAHAAAKLSELQNRASTLSNLCCNEILRLVLTDVANELRENGALDEEECFIDATFVMAKGGGSEIGPTKRGKGMKIMAIVDRHGLPLLVSTHAANHHEVRLVQLFFDFYMIEAKPENLIGDRAYDSDPLDEELRNDGIEMIAPHRSNRSKPPTQDRRRLSRYTRRWLVERFFAWIQWQRLERLPGGICTHWKVPPFHGARQYQTLTCSRQDVIGTRLMVVVSASRKAL